MSLAADRDAVSRIVLERKVSAQRDYIAFLEHENEQLRGYKERAEGGPQPPPPPTGDWLDRLHAWWKRVGP